MTIKQENLCLLAVEHARSVNNFIDCDVIQEAMTMVEGAGSATEAVEALAYLETAIIYRRGVGDQRVTGYKRDFISTLATV